uniref:Uncharacterized protein n=1 Tax=Anopheles atroparvus TaxID=41427 RepID=A0A182IPK8_ANOAO
MVKLMESAAIYALLIQGSTKFYTALRYHKFFIAMYGRLDRFHQEHRLHAKNNATLLLLMQRIHLVTRLITVQYVVSTIVFAIFPLLGFLWNGDRILCVSLLIPFTDPAILSHYLLNLLWQLYLLMIGVPGFAAAESVILLFVASLAGYADVLQNEIDELNTMLVEAEHPPAERTAVKQKLLEIARLHQRILEYENDLDERYYLNNLVQVFSAVFMLTGSLFLCYVSNYPTMYVLAATGTIQLFELCLLGTILSVKNEEIESTFYNSQWYLMDRSEKSTFLLMLHRSQHAVEMFVANMVPLNIVLFVTILRKIYAFLMMLINFYE